MDKMFKRTSCFKDVIWAKGDMGEDMLMCLQFVYNASKVVHLPKAFYYYYNNPLSISSAMSKEAIVYRFQQSIANANDLVYFLNEMAFMNSTLMKWTVYYLVKKSAFTFDWRNGILYFMEKYFFRIKL